MKTVADMMQGVPGGDDVARLTAALAARGRLDEAAHRQELAWIEEQQRTGRIDDGTAQALRECIERLMPPEDAATVVAPAAASAADEPTVVKPLHSQSPGGSNGDVSQRSSTFGSSSWRRMPQLEGNAEVKVGSVLKGRFLLERELGRGGMGVVYLARDARKVEARDRDPYVAIKVLNDEFRRHPDSLIALQRESRRAQRFAHDNIVRVHDFDKDGATVFMTMEYIDGHDLRSAIRRRGGEALPFAQAWPLIQGMAGALGRAHAAGVVHSDFKPGNVMVAADGVAKVFDFGIARAAKRSDGAHGDQTVFDAGTLGAMTPAYASPEMLRGQAPTFADDVYALGCVVYELLTGRHPFDKRDAKTAQEAGAKMADVPGLNRRQNTALRHSLAFDPGQRLATVEALAEGLRPRSLRQRLVPAAAAGAALLLLGGLGAALWFQHLDERRSEQVLARFESGASDEFHDEAQARTALLALQQDRRRRLLVDKSGVIEGYLLRRVDRYWAPTQGRDDYAGVRRVLAVREELKLFAPRLDARTEAVERERAGLLNQLDTRLNEAIARDAIFDGDENAAPAILRRIRRLDPDSALLRNPALVLKYEQAIAQSAAADDAGEARRRLAVAQQALPDAPAWRRWRQELDAHAAQSAVAAAAPAEEDVKRAELDAGIQSFRSAVAAGDVDKAGALLRKLAALDPRQAFATGEGRAMLASAYLDKARRTCRSGQWAEAAAIAKAGVAALDGDPALNAAQERYDLVADVFRTARAADAKPTERVALKARMEKIRKQDAAAYAQLEQDVGAASGGARRSLADYVDGARSPPMPAPPAAAASVACQAGIAGAGRSCRDTLSSGGAGPDLVVVPGGERLRPFAMMRAELSYAELTVFCQAAQACTVSRRVNPADPVGDVSVSLLRRYAQWLTSASGHTYRLPTETEWLHAAGAGAGWNDAAASYCVPEGKRAPWRPRFGEKVGRNPWGLENMIGSVAEFVVVGDSLHLRGGSYRDRGKDCSVEGMRPADGQPVKDAGVRLVREL